MTDSNTEKQIFENNRDNTKTEIGNRIFIEICAKKPKIKVLPVLLWIDVDP